MTREEFEQAVIASSNDAVLEAFEIKCANCQAEWRSLASNIFDELQKAGLV